MTRHRQEIKLSVALTSILALPVLLAGCFGNDTEGGNTASAPLVYSGVTQQVTFTTENATPVTEASYMQGGSSSTFGDFRVKPTATGTTPAISRLAGLGARLLKTLDANGSSALSYKVVSSSGVEQSTCNSGSFTYSTSYDDADNTVPQVMTVSFSNYCDDSSVPSVTMNGGMTISIGLSVIALEFDNFKAVSSEDNFMIDGTLETSLSSSSMTMNLVFKDSSGDGKVYKLENLIMTASVSGVETSLTMEGRVYDPDYGYVDITTPTGFVVDNTTGYASAGVMELAGSGGTKTRLTANSGSYVIEVDTGGGFTEVKNASWDQLGVAA